MREPVLIVMAAGMGSRYGGLKQLDPVGPGSRTIMDYSLYDARRAGFERVVFVISEAMEKDFPQDIQQRIGRDFQVQCAVQRISDVPAGIEIPRERTKPWGTGHAVRACREVVDAPFAAINADDYYGPEGFARIYDFLKQARVTTPRQYAMVGFELAKTLSKTGHVARGVCLTDEKGKLVEIHERTHIIGSSDGPLFTEDGQRYERLPVDTVVSMNLWGFTEDFMDELDARFEAFLRETVQQNPLKAEYFLPEVVGAMLREGMASVDVLSSPDTWYGMTYKEDRPIVQEAIREKMAQGLYPEKLWK